jgi:hypothetical protein
MRNRLLTNGRFLTLLPRSALELPGKHPSIKALPVELTNARGTIGIIMLRNRSLSPLAELFIETMRAVTKALAISQRR